ncbi:MAG: ribosome silencing factor [Alphaproteobacteria bacterium]|nr:ribosome silencing factor [Alphaproteobacteria bacterium]
MRFPCGPCVLGLAIVHHIEERPLPALRSPKTGTSDPASPASPASDPVPEDAGQLARLVAAQLEDDKAENILEINLVGKSSLADAMIIASGRSQRHVTALADHVARRLKDAGASRLRVEGLPNADWVLIDAGDLIVHIFRPEVREFYNLERIWSTDAAPPPGADPRAADPRG